MVSLGALGSSAPAPVLMPSDSFQRRRLSSSASSAAYSCSDFFWPGLYPAVAVCEAGGHVRVGFKSSCTAGDALAMVTKEWGLTGRFTASVAPASC